MGTFHSWNNWEWVGTSDDWTCTTHTYTYYIWFNGGDKSERIITNMNCDIIINDDVTDIVYFYSPIVCVDCVCEPSRLLRLPYVDPM